MILHLLCILETIAENVAWCIIFSRQMVLFWKRKMLQRSATLEGNLNPRLKIKMVVDFVFFFFRFIYFIICKYHSCLQTLQKKASDLITDGCEPPCDCWGLNSGLSEEQSGALTH